MTHGLGVTSSTQQVAVIGTRGVGRSHVAALREVPGVQISLIVASTADTASAAARALSVPCWSTDWQSAISDAAISAVHICTPNHLHLPIAAAALAAGKHVICEKPLAVNASEAIHLAQLARQHNDQLSVLGYKYRYTPLLRQLREHVQHGTLGRVHEIRGSYLQNWMLDAEQSSWRHNADQAGRRRVLLDIGTHLIDLMETVLDQPAVKLRGELFAADPALKPPRAESDSVGATDDAAHLLLQFNNGIRGIAALSQISAAHTHQIRLAIDGAARCARWTLGDVETLTLSEPAENSRLRPDGNTSQAASGTYWRLNTEPDRLLVPLFADAYRRVSDAASPPPPASCDVPTPSFEDGCRHLQLIQTVE